MTARSPIWYNGGSLQEMTAAEIVQWQVAAIFVYASSPTSVLTINTGSAGSSQPHNHGLAGSNTANNIRPHYVDVIICSKN